MGLFDGANESANARLAGMGKGEYGQEDAPPQPGPAAPAGGDLEMLLMQVQPPELAEAIKAAIGMAPAPMPEAPPEGDLDDDPVV